MIFNDLGINKEKTKKNLPTCKIIIIIVIIILVKYEQTFLSDDIKQNIRNKIGTFTDIIS